MTFIVDGSEWSYTEDEARANLPGDLETLLDFVSIGMEREEKTLVGQDFQTKTIVGENTLWELFGGNSPVILSGEVYQELSAWLGKSPFYVDLPDWPEDADETMVSIAGAEAFDNSDVAWVHHCVRGRRASACYSRTRRGLISTQTALGTVEVYFVNTEADRIAFWRNAIGLEGDNAATLRRMARHAYPSVQFHPGVLEQVDDLDGGYHPLRHQVQHTFAMLNDHGNWLFTCPPPAVSPEEPTGNGGGEPPKALIRERFTNLGLVGEPENPNVRLDNNCRVAREVTVSGKVFYCEWHIKLELHRNRIHVHGPEEETDNRVLVGIIARHLPLP